jgi:hypothetical protein
VFKLVNSALRRIRSGACTVVIRRALAGAGESISLLTPGTIDSDRLFTAFAGRTGDLPEQRPNT